MLRFKLLQNRIIIKNLTFEGDKKCWFQKFEKDSYRTAVQTHTENFSILA